VQSVLGQGFIFASHVGDQRSQAGNQLVRTAYQRSFERQRKEPPEA
jgi:hypothetical protein